MPAATLFTGFEPCLCLPRRLHVPIHCHFLQFSLPPATSDACSELHFLTIRADLQPMLPATCPAFSALLFLSLSLPAPFCDEDFLTACFMSHAFSRRSQPSGLSCKLWSVSWKSESKAKSAGGERWYMAGSGRQPGAVQQGARAGTAPRALLPAVLLSAPCWSAGSAPAGCWDVSPHAAGLDGHLCGGGWLHGRLHAAVVLLHLSNG